MIFINTIILSGRLTKDVDLKFIPSTGMAVARLTLAVDKDMSKDKKEEAQRQGKPVADFINITIFNKSAENCANFLNKGSQCLVKGRISTGSYETTTGEKRYTTDIIADKVEFIGSKGQAKPTEGRPVEFPDDDDIFQPVGDDDFIPF